MSSIIIGIGGIAASFKKDDILKTFALGSCVAVVMFDQKRHIAGMAHIALPDSSINPERALNQPGYFADTAIPALIRRMVSLGWSQNSGGMIVKLVGGATVMDPNGFFDIGNRNIDAIKKILREKRLGIFSEELGGRISRTVYVAVDTGEVTLSSQNLKARRI